MKKESVQKVLTIVSFVLPTMLLVMWFLSTLFLADNVAIYFNSSGNVGRIGEQYEMLIIGLVMYFIPIVMSVIFVYVKAFWVKLIGTIGSICVSIAYIGVSINLLVMIFKNSNGANYSSGLWTSFAFAIIGLICIIAAHILPFVSRNLIFYKKPILMLKKLEINKINIVLSFLIFVFGVITCIGCSALKNFYSFIVIFVTLAICIAIGCLYLLFINKKNFTPQEPLSN